MRPSLMNSCASHIRASPGKSDMTGQFRSFAAQSRGSDVTSVSMVHFIAEPLTIQTGEAGLSRLNFSFWMILGLSLHAY